MARPRLRTPELREDILGAAMTLLMDDGPAAITTRGVAAAAGTSPGAIAELFGGKPGLIREVFASGLELLNRQLSGAPRSDNPTKDLTNLGIAYRSFAAQQPYLFDVIFSRPFAEFSPRPQDAAVAKDIYKAFTRRFAQLLDRAQHSNAVVDAATGYVALLHGLAVQERAGILGSKPASANRRWDTAVTNYLGGATITTRPNKKDD